MRLPLAKFRRLLHIAVLCCGGIAVPPSVASALGPYLDPGFGPCVVPAALTDTLNCPWYDIADAGGFHGISTYDRTPTLATKEVDMCGIVRDQRHSTGLDEAENINRQNDGITPAPIGVAAQEVVADTDVDLVVNPDRTGVEYSLPMSRCDQYWCDPWYDCPAWEDADVKTEAEHDVAEDLDPSGMTADDFNPPADPLSGFDFSVCRAAVRPVASVASNWLGSLGQRLLGLSHALGQIADAEATEEFSDVPAPEPAEFQDASSFEEASRWYLGL